MRWNDDSVYVKPAKGPAMTDIAVDEAMRHTGDLMSANRQQVVKSIAIAPAIIWSFSVKCIMTIRRKADMKYVFLLEIFFEIRKPNNTDMVEGKIAPIHGLIYHWVNHLATMLIKPPGCCSKCLMYVSLYINICICSE